MTVPRERLSGGPHSYQITSAGILVHPRIEALLASSIRADDREPGRTSAGNEKLDCRWRGGVPRLPTMIMGPSGSVKLSSDFSSSRVVCGRTGY